jgi:hypothetical protein
MKPLIVAFTLLSAALVAPSMVSSAMVAQSGPVAAAPAASSPVPGPSYSDLYCSGFITRKAISRTTFVLGSKESPHADLFPGRSLLFLRGPALAQGERYSILRQVADPNREDSSPDQRKKLASLGDQYEDVGWVTVHSIKNGTAVASFDFSCGAAIPGDLIVPFKERPQIAFRRPEPELDTFRAHSAALKGHILGTPGFLGLLGNGLIVYTDFGAIKGAKPGDYLVISRGYAPEDLNKIDRISEWLPRGAEASAVNPVKTTPDMDHLMPDHILGELLVLSVSPESSTAIITRASAEMELGDVVQKEDGDSANEAAANTPANDSSACPPASLFRRALVFSHLSHGCKAAKGDSAAGR